MEGESAEIKPWRVYRIKWQKRKERNKKKVHILKSESKSRK
jgi:hypothetical protein